MELTVKLIEELRDEGLSWKQIGLFLADKMGEDPYVLQERARGKWRKYAKKQKHAETVVRKSRKINKDDTNVSEIETSGEEISLLDDIGLMKRHGFDPGMWKVVDSTCTLRSGRWSSRLKVAPREIPCLDSEELSRILVQASEKLPRSQQPVGEYERTITDKPTLAVVALYDVHYGRRGVMGSHEQTREDVQSVIESVWEKFIDYPVDKILLPIGQDFLNSDTVAGTTTKGTPQDNSLVWHEMLAGGLALIIWVVDMLSMVAPVELIYNEGNHDKVLSYGIVKALEQRYRGSDRVSVDSDPRPRKYRVFEENLIGLSHGKNEINLPAVMQMEEPRLWGLTSHRYWVLGHLHHLEMTDANGVTLLRCPSIAFTDEWEQHKAYVGADRAMACTIFDKNGLRDIWLMRP